MSSSSNNNNNTVTVLKMVFVGDVAVGKTSFIIRVADNDFSEYPNTVGVDFRVKMLEIQGKQLKIQLWDTAGQERFRTLTTSYFRGAHIIFLMYSINSEESFKSLEHWNDEIKYHADKNAKTFLIANKLDLQAEQPRSVSEERGRIFADKLGCEYFEVSCKENLHVDQVILTVCEEMVKSVAGTGGWKVSLAMLSPSKEQKKKKSPCTLI
jgi:small GTP-binding protein